MQSLNEHNHVVTDGPGAAGRLIYGMACMAVNQALQSALILDAPTESLPTLSLTLQELVEAAGASSVKRLFIPSDATEDELWGQLSISRFTAGGKSIANIALLVQPPEGGPVRILVISDLAHLGLPARRALTVLLDSPTAHLERHGLSQQWRPRLLCLAFCRTAELSHVSHHLLDRFAVRLDASLWEVPVEEQKTLLLDRMKQATGYSRAALPSISRDFIEKVQRSAQIRPRLAGEALEQIEIFAEGFGGQGHRRAIALARLSVAVAMLEAAEEVSPEHVIKAAEAQMLHRPAYGKLSEEGSAEGSQKPKETETAAEEPEQTSQEAQSEKASSKGLELEAGSQGVQASASGVKGRLTGESEPVISADEVRIEFELSVRAQGQSAYAEDALPREQMIGTLQPLRTALRPHQARGGPIIRSIRAASLRDLAFFDTLRAAAIYQRGRGVEPGQPMKIYASDLRQNLRAETPRKLFIIVVDQSDSVEVEWEEALSKELDSAYVERAPITVIIVGHVDGNLHAVIHTMASFHRGSIRAAFRKARGHASPLAHGLLLALRQIDKATTHGRDAVHDVRLIVATDGRANVPLSLSLEGMHRAASGLQAFEDALAVAEKIKHSSKVRSLLMATGSRHHPELPLKLAMALGAEYRLI